MRLELVADTYLSVGTPVQAAAPRLLQARRDVRAIRFSSALVQNYARSRQVAASYPRLPRACAPRADGRPSCACPQRCPRTSA